MRFEQEFFKKFEFLPEEINLHFKNALHDLEIARKDPFAEVRFTYSYQALIKGGIVLIAKMGNVKVRSMPGHHIKILEKMGEILEDPDILVLGDAMRMKRNADLYGGGELITEKEAGDYFKFVESIFNKIKNKIDK